MKKHHILFCLLALCCHGLATAQDTISLHGPKKNYFDNYWSLNTGDTFCVEHMRGNIAFGYATDDTLVVYGIAASLYLDEDYSHSITELLRLYKRTGTAVSQLGESLEVYMEDAPTYYMRQDFVQSVYSTFIYDTAPVFPVHERYFAAPIAITDSFYVGIYPSVNHYNNVCVSCFRRPTSVGIRLPIPNIMYTPETPSHPEVWHYYSDYVWGTPYIYAILTPPDTTILSSDTTYIGDTLIVTDTVIFGGDTIITTDTILSIQNGSMLERLTGVMPNPAVGTAKVVSSFGMSMVEAYDMSGTLVHRQKADGLATTLDVRRWPTGTYLLRIHTPQGTAVKKLVVRR